MIGHDLIQNHEHESTNLDRLRHVGIVFIPGRAYGQRDEHVDQGEKAVQFPKYILCRVFFENCLMYLR